MVAKRQVVFWSGLALISCLEMDHDDDRCIKKKVSERKKDLLNL